MKPSILLPALAAASVLSTPLLALPGGRETERVSVSSTGDEANFTSGEPVLSTDGRYVAFHSGANNLVAVDYNYANDVFWHDRQTGETRRVSVSSGGAQADGHSDVPAISGDGRFVVFISQATNLVLNDNNFWDDVFLHDTQTGTTTRVSMGMGGNETDGRSYDCTISADGSTIAFSSSATNLTPGIGNSAYDIFLYDVATGTNTRVSVSSVGVEADASSWNPRLSSDGRFVAFDSLATTLVPGDTNGHPDVFVHDTLTLQTERVSVSTAGAQGNSFSQLPSISGDGRYVAFESRATTLVPNDDNSVTDVFLHDRQTNVTSIMSTDPSGTYGNGSSTRPWLSADGARVSFHSWSSNFVPNDNGYLDCFVREVGTGAIQRVSIDSIGTPAAGHSYYVTFSGDGRYVAFDSEGSNLVPGDTSGWGDCFVHDTYGAASSTNRNPGNQNPQSYTATAPVLGQMWNADIDLTTTGHVFALVEGTTDPFDFTLAGGQVLFVAGTSVFSLPAQGGPLASWSLMVPGDVSFAGVAVYTQALHLGGVTPFALSNAQDLCLGF